MNINKDKICAATEECGWVDIGPDFEVSLVLTSQTALNKHDKHLEWIRLGYWLS